MLAGTLVWVAGNLVPKLGFVPSCVSWVPPSVQEDPATLTGGAEVGRTDKGPSRYPALEGSCKRGEVSKHQETLSPADLWGVLTRILEWVAFPFSRGSSQPRDQTQVSHTACGFFFS